MLALAALRSALSTRIIHRRLGANEDAVQHRWIGALAISVTLMGAHAPGPIARTADVAQLRWLAGCWELRTATRVTHEQWMAPLGGMMLGISRTVVRDTVREFEQLRIQTKNGVPTYIAKPSGQAESSFAATSVSDTSVVFDNPAHDFPQRISYRKAGADSIVARIEGPQGGQTRGINFPMKRVRCEG